MKAGVPSRTAAWVAAARTAGAILPAPARLVDDPWGARFADAALQQFVARACAHPAAAWAVVRHLPPLAAVVAWLQLRTRVLDDEVRRFVAAGGRQLVLLGAGYDCRAVRLRDVLADATVFEIDHPATQARKRAVLDAARAPSAPTRRLAWDFESRAVGELGPALHDVGHDPSRPSLTIWEGVTMYLTEPALDATTRAVAAWSSTGSRFAVTYFTRALLGRRGFVGAVVRWVGEPHRFGWEAPEFATWMAARGWRVARDDSDTDLATRLLPPEVRRHASTDGQRIGLLDRA